ncbi:hypothetical protein SK128_021638, partial [Halocaridina rubra]
RSIITQFLLIAPYPHPNKPTGLSSISSSALIILDHPISPQSPNPARSHPSLESSPDIAQIIATLFSCTTVISRLLLTPNNHARPSFSLAQPTPDCSSPPTTSHDHPSPSPALLTHHPILHKLYKSSFVPIQGEIAIYNGNSTR